MNDDHDKHINRPAVRTQKGVIELPRGFHAEEFALPGNSFEGIHLVAMYDGTSLTGAYYTHALRLWTLMQPVARDDWFAMVQAMDVVMPGTPACVPSSTAH